jgi:formylglycine-generating enzyme
MLSKYKYDIAISVAEEDTSVAEKISASLDKRKITHYYYKKNRAENWGRHILEISLDNYSANAKYVLLITSHHFVQKFWSQNELQISQALNKIKRPCLLQLRIDDTPLDGIGKHIVYEEWRDNAAEIAGILKEKISLRNQEIARKRKRMVSLFLTIPAAVGLLWLLPIGQNPRETNINPQYVVKKDSIPNTKKNIPGSEVKKEFLLPKPGTPQPITTYQSRLTNKVVIPAGSFTMGSATGNPNEAPAHNVTLSTFYISATEITVAQYQAYCVNTGKTMPPQPYTRTPGEYPVVNVTWPEAKEYCKWAGGRLPTEAEWEYAALARQTSKYSGGNNAALVAVYATNSGGDADKPAHKQPNAFGLYDMSGNVAEWCNDYYARAATSNPQGPKSGTQRVVRGGAYNSTIKPENQLQVTRRSHADPGTRSEAVGFRVVWDVK